MNNDFQSVWSWSFKSSLLGLLLFAWCSFAVLEEGYGDAPQDFYSLGQESYQAQDHQRALLLFEQACESKNGNGCADAGDMHREGEGGPSNAEIARSFFEKACEYESSEGCNSLAIMLYEGEGGEENQEQAKIYFARACKFKQSKGCF